MWNSGETSNPNMGIYPGKRGNLLIHTLTSEVANTLSRDYLKRKQKFTRTREFERGLQRLCD
jgi:hypothetical protein